MEGVEVSGDGHQVLIKAYANEYAGEATATCYVLGMSPGAMTQWPIEEQVVELGTQNEISFDFSRTGRPDDPQEGYYILILSCFGDDQHVFVDMQSGGWVAD